MNLYHLTPFAFILSYILTCVDPDPHLEYESVIKNLLNTDSIGIRFHNTTVKYQIGPDYPAINYMTQNMKQFLFKHWPGNL